MDIRLMAFDLDGTLRGRHGFPEINLRALGECRRRGIRLVFCSGRVFEVLRGFAKEAGADPWLASCNGARIDRSIDGPTLEEHTFDEARSRRIFETLRRSGLYFTAYARGKCYMGNSSERLRYGDRYRHHYAHTVTDGGYSYETVDDMLRFEREGVLNPYKYVVLGSDFDPRFDEIKAELADMRLSVSSSANTNFEMMTPGTDKGAAIRKIAAMEGVPMENVMAFGDNTNDLSMLQAAGWPVAMGNGEPPLKAAARIIAPDCEEGGVGRVIEKYVLGDEAP